MLGHNLCCFFSFANIALLHDFVENGFIPAKKLSQSRGEDRWKIVPLLQGEIHSAFEMMEPAVASSDATNVTTTYFTPATSIFFELILVVATHLATF